MTETFKSALRESAPLILYLIGSLFFVAGSVLSLLRMWRR